MLHAHNSKIVQRTACLISRTDRKDFQTCTILVGKFQGGGGSVLGCPSLFLKPICAAVVYSDSLGVTDLTEYQVL